MAFVLGGNCTGSAGFAAGARYSASRVPHGIFVVNSVQVAPFDERQQGSQFTALRSVSAARSLAAPLRPPTALRAAPTWNKVW